MRMKYIRLFSILVIFSNLSFSQETEEVVDEKLLFALLNIIDQDNKFLIITTKKPIVNFKFELNDLNSRLNNFLFLIP